MLVVANRTIPLDLFMAKKEMSAQKWTRKKYDRASILDRIQLLVDIMRVQANWNQVEFAKKAGITTPRLSHYLSRRYRPDVDSLASIAERLNVSMEWLVFGSGPMWAKDLENMGLGMNEAVLAVSSVLERLADSLRSSVIAKEGDTADPVGINRAIKKLLNEAVLPAQEAHA